MLAGNEAMLAFVVHAGFQVLHHFEDARLMRVGARSTSGLRPARPLFRSAAAIGALRHSVAGFGERAPSSGCGASLPASSTQPPPSAW